MPTGILKFSNITDTKKSNITVNDLYLYSNSNILYFKNEEIGLEDSNPGYCTLAPFIQNLITNNFTDMYLAYQNFNNNNSFLIINQQINITHINLSQSNQISSTYIIQFYNDTTQIVSDITISLNEKSIKYELTEEIILEKNIKLKIKIKEISDTINNQEVLILGEGYYPSIKNFSLSSNKVYYNKGNIGIGTNNPSCLLNIYNGNFKIENNSNYISINENITSKNSIKINNNLGINTRGKFYNKTIINESKLYNIPDLSCDYYVNISDDYIISKTGVNLWDNNFYSLNGYSDSCYLKFKTLKMDSNTYYMIGLSKTPYESRNENQNYKNTINYGWYINALVLTIYEYDGTFVTFDTFKADDIFEIIYENSKIKYYHNGKSIRTQSIADNPTFYLSGSIHNIGDNQGQILQFSQNYNENELGIDHIEDIQKINFNGGLNISDYSFNQVIDVPRLYNSSGITIDNNNIISKTGGSDNSWDTQVYSFISYNKRCYLKFKTLTKTKRFMLSLNSDPTTNSSYTSLDYSLYLRSGELYIYESNNEYGKYADYEINDIFEIIHENSKINYYHNGKLLRSTFDWLSMSNNLSINNDYIVSRNTYTVDGTANNIAESWNSHIYSHIGYTGSCYLKFKILGTTAGVAVGLNTDTDLSNNTDVNSIDYTWDLWYDGNSYIYESGSWISMGAYLVNSVYEIIYTGNTLIYYCDGVVKRRLYLSENLTFYLDSSFHHNGQNIVQILDFGKKKDLEYPIISFDNTSHLIYVNIVAQDYLEGVTLWKTGGANDAEDAQVYSKIGYTGGCHLKFKKQTTNMAAFPGISSSPDTSVSNSTVDYAWSTYLNSYAYVYSKGSDQGTNTTYSANDTFEIIYDNSTIKYYHNSIEKHSINVVSGLTFYLDIGLLSWGQNAGRIITWEATETTTHSTKLNSYNIEKTNQRLYLDSSFYNTGTNQCQILQFTEYYDKNKLGKNSLIIPESKGPELAGSDFTIEFWAKIDDLSNDYLYHIIYTQGDKTIGNNLSIYFRHNGINKGIHLDFYGAEVYTILDIDETLWNHYSIVFDNSTNPYTITNATKFYINGNLKNTLYLSGIENTRFSGTGKSYIGYDSSGVYYFEGKLKNFSISNNVKTQNEILDSINVNDFITTFINKQPISSNNLVLDIKSNYISSPYNIDSNFNGTINTNDFSFDGTNDYFEIPANIAPQLANSPFTIEFWIKIPSDFDGQEYIYSQRAGDALHGKTLNIYIYKYASNHSTEAGNFSFGIQFYDGDTGFILTENIYERWMHIALIHHNDSFKRTCYINGVKRPEPTSQNQYTQGIISAGGSHFTTIASGEVYIGKLYHNTHYFSGEIKHLRVYNDIKTQSEITQSITDNGDGTFQPNLTDYLITLSDNLQL